MASDTWPPEMDDDMEFSESELYRALLGLEVTLREPVPGGSVVGSPDGWKPFSARGRCLHPQDVVTDLKARVTAERARRAADEAECRAEGPRCDRKGGPCTCPDFALSPPPETTPADPEVAAMAAIVAVMDALDDHAILLGTDVHERVIRWAMARWNVRA